MPRSSARASINASYDLYRMTLDQLSLVDPRRLLVLDAVGRHGSLAGAARSLSLTPSAVSQQIAALERECGTPLLERSARSIRFTDAGQRLITRAASLRHLLEHAQADLATLRGAERRGLSLGIFESVARRFLPGVLKRFGAAHPNVAVKVHQLEPEPALELLRRGDLDVAVTHSYSLTPLAIPGGLVRTAVGDDSLVIVMSADAPAPSRLSSLSDAQWIGPDSEYCRQTLLQACRRSGFEPRIESTVSDYRFAEQLVAAGFGVALAPSLALSTRPVPRTARYRLPEVGIRNITAWQAPGSSRASCVDALVGMLAARVSKS
jgi:molybdate transport repressor ModE-like protein